MLLPHPDKCIRIHDRYFFMSQGLLIQLTEKGKLGGNLSHAGIDVDDPAARTWYRKSGSGQGATLNIAASLDAFVLADVATWIAFDNKANLVPKGCRGESLRNVYGVLLGYDGEDVDGGGEGFARWLLGPGQAVIEAFEVRGQRPFVPVSQAGRDDSLPVVEALCGMATPDR